MSAGLTLMSTTQITVTYVLYVKYLNIANASCFITQSHSEVPERDEDWPTLEDILEYRDRIRARLMQVYDDLDTGKRVWNRSIGRVLHMTFEHEGFHIEVGTLWFVLWHIAADFHLIRHFCICLFNEQEQGHCPLRDLPLRRGKHLSNNGTPFQTPLPERSLSDLIH